MRRLTYFVMALALVLALAQCKKGQPTPTENEGEKVTITLVVTNGDNTGSRVEVDPPHVNFQEGDIIFVASGGQFISTLEHNGSVFSGEISPYMAVANEPLYFYFFGNKVLNIDEIGGEWVNYVDIDNQTEELPVISMAPSNEVYNSERTSYTASLHNKCSLMKFIVTTPSNSSICITGMNNRVYIDFSKAANDSENNGFTYGKVGDGVITMKGVTTGNTETWAIVLPQAALTTTGDAYTSDNAYTGTRPPLDEITTNQYLSTGVSMFVNTAHANINGSGNTSGWTNNGGDPWGGSGGGGNNNLGGWTNSGNGPW